MSESHEQHELEIAKLEAEVETEKQRARKLRLEADEIAEDARARHASEYHHRIYTFDEPVTSASAAKAIARLGLWLREDGGERPIRIVFNSPGGSVFDGLALYDFIVGARRDYGVQIDTEAIGMAASMGGVLLQAGEQRTMSPNSFMLIHEVSAGAIGNMSELKDKVKFTEQLQDRCLAILASRSTLTKRQIKNRWKRRDWWLLADEAVELGFADEVR